MDYERAMYVMVAIMLVVAIAKGPALLRARQMKGRKLTGLAGVLPAGADPAGRYLLYFWSPSCGMCRSTTPIIEELMEGRQDVLSLNVLDHMDLAQEAGIMGTPAFMLLDKQVVERLVFGARSRKQMLEMLGVPPAA